MSFTAWFVALLYSLPPAWLTRLQKQIRWAYHRNEYMDRWSERDLIDLDAHVGK